jgi:hypothetical protein
MNALFLKDLAYRVCRRRGRDEDVKSGGGNSRGYEVVKGVNAKDAPVRGSRTI